MKIVKLGELASIQTGKIDVNKAVVGGKYPFFTCSREAYEINDAPYEGKAVLVAGNGDLNVKYYEGKFNAYQRTYFLFANNENKLIPRYLYWFLESYVGHLRSESIGSTIKYIKMGNLTEAEIPLPSLEKQRQIVEKLDRAFAEIHAAIEKNETLIRFSRDLLSSYIQEIYAEREVEHTENLGDLLELLADHRGKTPKKLGSDFVESGVRIISAANITKGAIRFERKERYISQSTYEKWMPKPLMRGDVILTSEAPLGEVAQVDFDDPIAIGQRLFALRGKFDRISNDYLRYFLISERGQSELRARETGATAIGIRQSELVQLRVPIIPIELQLDRIQILKEVELLSISLLNLFQKKIALFNELNSAILSEAFAGERQ